jgi:hypothetical protein
VGGLQNWFGNDARNPQYIAGRGGGFFGNPAA